MCVGTSYWLFEVFVLLSQTRSHFTFCLGRGFRFHSSDCAREGKPGHGENANEGRLLCGTRQQTERPREKQVRKPVQSRKLRAGIGSGSFQAELGNGPETQILVVDLCQDSGFSVFVVIVKAAMLMASLRHMRKIPLVRSTGLIWVVPLRLLNSSITFREEVPSDDGSSADEGSAPKNSGWIGKGYPLQVGVGYTVRDYCDGQSLCSPDKWALAARRYPETETWQEVISLFRSFARQYGTAKLLMDLALGRVEEMPSSLKAEIVSTLQIRGLLLKRQAGDRDELPVDFRFIDLLLRASEDPERHLGSFAQGVKVGPGSRMPRLPALYKAKRRWRLPEQRDPMNYLQEEQQSENPWRQNYATVAGLADKVLAVLEDHVSRGQVRKYTEAEAVAMYPGLVIASLGANRKDKPNGVVTARVLHDGTNGLAVNTRTRIRDQERSPIASDLKRCMREKAEMQQPTFALTADVSEEQRQVPIHPDDWKFLGCRVEKGGSVYVNTVGTFGISSASYYWSRVAGAIGRLAQYLAGHSSATWHMLVADDFHLEAGGRDYRFSLFAFFILCGVSGVPLSWAKTAGGDTVTSVGFELLHHSRQLGISQRRAEWFMGWTSDVSASRTIHMRSFEEGLGRVMYVAGALEYERPFLGPLYKFMSLHPRDSVQPVPAYVSFFLRHLSDQLKNSRHYDCSAKLFPSQLSPRVDAQASSGRTGIGGWFPRRSPEGGLDTFSSK